MKILLIDIDPDGTVYGKRGKPLKPRVHYGYWKVRLSSGWCPVHRLLANKYIPNPLGYETVNHKDGDKLNNALSNLEWVSRKDNLYHAMDNGLHAWGRTSVTNSRNETFKSQAEAAREYQTHQGNICRAIKTNGLCQGLYWRYT